MGDGAVVHERERRTIGRTRSRRLEDPLVGDVHDHAALVRAYTASDERFPPVFADGDDMIGEPARELLLCAHESTQHLTATREATGEELGHQIVQIEDHGNAMELRPECAEDQEVREVVDLHAAIPMPAVQRRDLCCRARAESHVARELVRESPLVELDVEPVDLDAAVALAFALAGVAQADDVDLVPGADQRLRFALHARFGKRVVRMHDHAVPGRCGGFPVGHAPAPRRSRRAAE